MKTGMETIRGFRDKLRMMGVPIDSPTFGDNLSVIRNVSKPESTIRKKNQICYHALRESVDIGELLCTNEACMDTQLISLRRYYLVERNERNLCPNAVSSILLAFSY
jgi:hypothetical protein